VSTVDPDQPWRGMLNQVLYGLAYVAEPDDATAQVFAQRMIERRIFPSGPQEYLDGLDQAVRAPDLLAGTISTGRHDETTVRSFCERIVHHLRAAQATTYASGWPPERFTVLSARDWPWATARATVVITAGMHEVAARTWAIFEFHHSLDGTTPVLVLRLRTGEVIALVGSPGPTLTDRRMTTLKVLDGSPSSAVDSFLDLTGFPAESLVLPDTIPPATDSAAARRGELEMFRVFVANGRLYRADNGTAFDTTLGTTLRPGPNRAIFAMDSQGNLYASLVEIIARFHHSSLLAGRPAAGAGEIVAEAGRLLEISGRSPTYSLTDTELDQVLAVLAADGLPTGDVVVHRG